MNDLNNCVLYNDLCGVHTFIEKVRLLWRSVDQFLPKTGLTKKLGQVPQGLFHTVLKTSKDVFKTVLVLWYSLLQYFPFRYLKTLVAWHVKFPFLCRQTQLVSLSMLSAPSPPKCLSASLLTSPIFILLLAMKSLNETQYFKWVPSRGDSSHFPLFCAILEHTYSAYLSGYKK